MLTWVGHIERIKEDWLVKRIVGSNVRGMRLRGRPQMDGLCVKSIEWKRNVCRARKDDCA